jgi:hypothetical protein
MRSLRSLDWFRSRIANSRAMLAANIFVVPSLRSLPKGGIEGDRRVIVSMSDKEIKMDTRQKQGRACRSIGV